MKQYEEYSVEDFVQDENFRDWVQGQSQQETFWLSFPQKYPGRAEEMKQAEKIIRAVNVPSELLSEREIRAEVQAFLLRSAESPAEPTQKLPTSPVFGFPLNTRWAMIAAVLTAVLGVSWYFWPTLATQTATSLLAEKTQSGLVQTDNSTQQPLRILLSDSTEVVLSPNSSLNYPMQFSDTARVVFLRGEASFSVTHRGLPFLVHSEDMITRVLGTKFVVRAYHKDRKFTVQVLSGKVSVYRAGVGKGVNSKKANGLILTANQAAIFEKDKQHLTKTLVANPTVVSKLSAEVESRYEEVALPVILHDLERSYGIAIQFDEQSLHPCKVTATLGDESLYQKLDMLCKTVAASYQIVDGQIIISGKGCP